jgi:hypothetical protein
MENLFIQPVEREKIAMTNVSTDSTKWVKEIIGSLLRSFPELANAQLSVSFHQKDDKKGFAVASVKSDGFSIPAVISDFQLNPLDVIIVNGTMLPLTKATLLDLMSTSSAFQDVAKGRKELVTRVFDSPLAIPTDNYGTSYSTGSMLDKMSSFVEKSDYERLLAEITKPENYAGFTQNGTLDVIEKVANLKPASATDFAKDTLSNLNIDRQAIFEDEFGNRHLKQANSTVDYTWTTKLDPEDDMKPKYANRAKQGKASNGEVAPGNTYPINEGILYLTKEGEYYVFNKQEHTKIASRVQNFEVNGNSPSMNDHGIFVVGDEATSPFEVVGLQKVAGMSNYEIIGWDGLKRTTYIPLKGIHKTAMIAHEELDNTYYVPGNAKFVKLAGELQVTFAAVDADLNKNYIEKDDIGLYSLSGPGFTKYSQSHAVQDLTEDEVIWAAIHCGATSLDLEKVSQLVTNSHVKLAGDIKSPMTTSELEQIIDSKYDNLISSVPTVNKLLVKEAAGLASKDSVDAILSLGLLNKRNVLEYITYIPQYEQCLSELSKLLVAARIGLPNVNSLDVKEAMEGLSSVIYALKGLQSIIDDRSN